jgi:hypothetical protein
MWQSYCSARAAVFASLVGAMLLIGCTNTNTTTTSTQVQDLANSYLGAGGNPLFQSTTFRKSQLNGANLSTFGLNFVLSLTAGKQPMNFTATPTAPWLTVSPTFGTLQPGGRTAIGIISINATSLPNAKNTAGVTASAPGYTDNTLICIEVNCGVGVDSSGNTLCQVAFSGDPSQLPLP